jgi:hypothetical protein
MVLIVAFSRGSQPSNENALPLSLAFGRPRTHLRALLVKLSSIAVAVQAERRIVNQHKALTERERPLLAQLNHPQSRATTGHDGSHRVEKHVGGGPFFRFLGSHFREAKQMRIFFQPSPTFGAIFSARQIKFLLVILIPHSD